MNTSEISNNISYLETLCEITSWCELNHELPKLQELREGEGSLGLYRDYMELAMEFEKENEGVEWGIVKEFFDEVELFLSKRFKD